MEYPALLELAVKYMVECLGLGYSQAKRLQKKFRDCSSLIARAMTQAGYEYGCQRRPVPLSTDQCYEDGFELLYPFNDAYDKIGKNFAKLSDFKGKFNLTRGDNVFVARSNSRRANRIEHIVCMVSGEKIIHARGTAYGVRYDNISLYSGKIAAVTRFNPLCDLVQGHWGNRVRALQKALNTKLGSELTVDGQFGAKTRAAVLKFQASYPGLAVNGKGDKATRAALKIQDAFSAPDAPDPTTRPTLSIGDNGLWVKTMQTKLLEAGEKLPKHGADSDFGKETLAALVSYQSKQGIPDTGVCDPITWNHLFMEIEDGGVIAEPPADNWRVKVLGDSVYLRDLPSSSKGKIRGVVYKGAVLKATGATMDKWYNVIYNGENLWISGNLSLSILYAHDGEDPAPVVIEPSTRTAITDLSKWNGKNYNWGEYKKNVLFHVLRISCGTTKDDLFDWMMKNSIDNDIPTYVYMYTLAKSVAQIQKETKKLLEYLAPYKDKVLGIVLDAETSHVTRAMGNAFVSTLRENGWTKRTGFYIAHHLYKSMNLDTTKVDIVWIPHYGKNNGTVSSKPSYFCHLHQFTSRGKVKGCGDSTIDLNRIMDNSGKSREWFVSLNPTT